MKLISHCLLLLSAATLLAQQPQPKSFELQSSSTVAYKNDKDSEAIEIKNVVYAVAGPEIPGRPKDSFLLLRETVLTKRALDEIGIEGQTTIEAWPLGNDPKQKPLYSLNASGGDPSIIDNALISIRRGLEEVDWWSVYKLGSGQRLFDTYVPLAKFSISREAQTLRYVGLEVPPDDIADNRLKAPNVVAVITYASADRVIREALITCDDAKSAQLLRSFADSTRTLTVENNKIRIAISQNYPSQPKTVTIDVPIARDDLDLGRSLLPSGIHVAAWKR
jgi:hypothetical protein